jgi:hypothetical protein
VANNLDHNRASLEVDNCIEAFVSTSAESTFTNAEPPETCPSAVIPPFHGSGLAVQTGRAKGEEMGLEEDKNRAEDGELDKACRGKIVKAQVFTKAVLPPYIDAYPHSPISHNASYPASYSTHLLHTQPYPYLVHIALPHPSSHAMNVLQASGKHMMLSSVGEGGKSGEGIMMVSTGCDKTAKGLQHPTQDHPATVVAEFPFSDDIVGKKGSKAAGPRGHQIGRKLVEDSEWKGEQVVLNMQSGGVGQTMVLDI